MPKLVWIVLSLGVIVRLFVAAFTFHPDFRPFQYTGSVVASGNILNLYDYPKRELDPRISQIILLNYPPAIYLYYGLYTFVTVNLAHLTLVSDYLIEQPDYFTSLLFSLHLLLIKSAYLFFDIPCAFLLAKLFDDKKQKIMVFALWIFNPINLFATYMMGQFDVIAVFCTIYSLVLVKQKKLLWAALILGFGIAFKIYPLYLLFPVILLAKPWLDRLKITVLGLSPYLFSILPYLSSPGYRENALLANQSLKSLYAQINISGGEAILLFPAILIFFYIWLYYHPLDLWKSQLIILIIFFIFTHTHPQWLLWLTPFIIISLIKSRFQEGLLVLGILVSWFCLLFLFDQSLTLGLFAPIWPNLYNGLSIWQFLKISPDTTFLRSIFQSLFVGLGAYLIYLKLLANRNSD